MEPCLLTFLTIKELRFMYEIYDWPRPFTWLVKSSLMLFAVNLRTLIVGFEF